MKRREQGITQNGIWVKKRAIDLVKPVRLGSDEIESICHNGATCRFCKNLKTHNFRINFQFKSHFSART